MQIRRLLDAVAVAVVAGPVTQARKDNQRVARKQAMERYLRGETRTELITKDREILARMRSEAKLIELIGTVEAEKVDASDTT